MGSISKRHKLSEEQYEDRISNLPNSLIAQILSCLPTKYAVSTSVISTRWKELWTSITSFDFDDELLLCPQNKSTDPAMQRSFTSFVHRVLLHHVSCVQRFRLKCSQKVDASLVNRWIADIILRNVRELDLYLSVRMHSVMLPEEFFTCRTLVVLKLNAYGDMNAVPSSASLPSLRILHLSGIKFVNDDSINWFLLGCPVLEELSMVACVGENVSVINIVAPMLTSLSMVNSLFRSREQEDEFERKIVLDTPALLYLTIEDSGEDGSYLVENSHHLVRADIDLYTEGMLDISKVLTDLLKGLSDVQFLKLGFTFTMGVYLRDIQLPKFLNMTYLELGDFHGEWKLLLVLLKNSPHLETLIVKDGLGYDFEYNFEDAPFLWDPARNVPSCLLYHLKVIEIYYFSGEWKFVDYLLQNSKVLEKVNIDYGDGGSKWTINASRS